MNADAAQRARGVTERFEEHDSHMDQSHGFGFLVGRGPQRCSSGDLNDRRSHQVTLNDNN